MFRIDYTLSLRFNGADFRNCCVSFEICDIAKVCSFVLVNNYYILKMKFYSYLIISCQIRMS